MFAQMLKRSYPTIEQTFYIQTWLFPFPDDDPKIVYSCFSNHWLSPCL